MGTGPPKKQLASISQLLAHGQDRRRGNRLYLKSIFDCIYPFGIYLLFWFNVILDFGSTVLAMNLGFQYRWIEANPLFYSLGPVPFFAAYVFINISLFLLAFHHQTLWKRGAVVLLISVLIHGLYGINNLIQILRC